MKTSVTDHAMVKKSAVDAIMALTVIISIAKLKCTTGFWAGIRVR